MAKKHSTFDYELLVRYMLPQGMLDYFEITKIEEEVTDEKDEECGKDPHQGTHIRA